LVEILSAFDQPTLSLKKSGMGSEEEGEKDALTGPPLTAVRGVASAFAAQDAHDQSSR
jgi:hypothetical protein